MARVPIGTNPWGTPLNTDLNGIEAKADQALNALGLKAPISSPSFTGTVSGVTKAHVGLASVNDTADMAKPVSTAQQAAINAKAAIVHVHEIAQVTGLQTAMDDLTAGQFSGAAGDLTGQLYPFHVAPTTVLSVRYANGAWPPRPTTRTNVVVYYVAIEAANPPPTDYVAGVDLLFRPSA